MRKLIVLCLLVFVPALSFGDPLAGSGTETAPYVIANLNDFIEFCSNPIYWGDGVYSKLETDLNLISQTYTRAPIAWDTLNTGGWADTSYCGQFDGCGHTISNLNINGQYYVGLFGNADNNSYIRNIKITDSTITGSGDNVGVIAGRSEYGVVENCSIVNSTVNGARYVGGVCGFNCSKVRGCKLDVDVNGGAYTGGVCGSNMDSISNCIVEGEVSGSSNVGGVCGIMGTGTTVFASFSHAIVEGSGDRVGGVSGESQGLIKCCGSSNSVTGSNALEDQYYTAGICGYNNYGDIEYCYSHAAINGEKRVGGVCGYNYGDGTITGCYSTGNVSGDYRVGGVCGWQNGTSGVIDTCYSSGAVSGPANSYINGFCGENRSGGIIVDCYWDAEADTLLETVHGDYNYTAEGRNTAAMKEIQTYVGWDYIGYAADGQEDDWRMCVNGVGYPRLWWEDSRNGDIVCNDGVDIYDLEVLAENWLTVFGDAGWYDNADLDFSGSVDLYDLARMAKNWPGVNN